MEKRITNSEMVELVRKVQNGDDNSLNILCERCEHMIKYFSCKKWFSIIQKYRLDKDEVEQEMYLSFIQGVYKFPPHYSNFQEYAYSYIKGGALNFFKHNTNRKNIYDVSEGDLDLRSVDIKYGEGEKLTFLDNMVDETAKEDFDQLITKIDVEIERKNIEIIIKNVIPDINVNLLFDMYGLNGVDYTFKELCKKYHIKLKQLLCWERMIVLLLRTHPNLDTYITTYMYDIKLLYNYSNISYTSSILNTKINSMLNNERITELTGGYHTSFKEGNGKLLIQYVKSKQPFDFTDFLK